MHYNTHREKKWYAVYTRSRSEKKAAKILEAQNIKVFLPLVKTLRQWSDRKKKVEMPLFKSYLFVNIGEAEKIPVRQTDSVVRIVSFNGVETVIPEQQIKAIKLFMAIGHEVPIDAAKYSRGDKVEVIYGLLKGLRGQLIQIRGKNKVLIEIVDSGKAIYLDINPLNIVKVRELSQ